MATKDGKKTGGRKKGTPNKPTYEILDILAEADFDPLRNLIELCPHLELREQAQINMALMPYVYPRRKSIEVTGTLTQIPTPQNLETIDPRPSINFLREILKLPARTIEGDVNNVRSREPQSKSGTSESPSNATPHTDSGE